MKCNCMAVNIFLGIIILLFAVISTPVSGWIIVISAIILIVHALVHKKTERYMQMPIEKKTAKRRR